VLRRIFGLKKGEVIRVWRKQHNNLYFLPSIIRMFKVKEDEMGRVCSTNGEKMIAYGILVGKPEGKRPLGRPRCRCLDNINMDLREIEWGGMDSIDVVQDRDQRRALVKMVLNLQAP
jgi:hypothetical protein